MVFERRIEGVFDSLKGIAIMVVVLNEFEIAGN